MIIISYVPLVLSKENIYVNIIINSGMFIWTTSRSFFLCLEDFLRKKLWCNCVLVILIYIILYSITL